MVPGLAWPLESSEGLALPEGAQAAVTSYDENGGHGKVGGQYQVNILMAKGCRGVLKTRVLGLRHTSSLTMM